MTRSAQNHVAQAAAEAAGDRLSWWRRSERKLDCSHHLAGIRAFEADLEENLRHGDVDRDEAVWCRYRIEGHAARAVVIDSAPHRTHLAARAHTASLPAIASLLVASAYERLSQRIATVWSHALGERSLCLDCARNAVTPLCLDDERDEAVARAAFLGALRHRRDLLLMRPFRGRSDATLEYLADMATMLWRSMRDEQEALEAAVRAPRLPTLATYNEIAAAEGLAHFGDEPDPRTTSTLPAPADDVPTGVPTGVHPTVRARMAPADARGTCRRSRTRLRLLRGRVVSPSERSALIIALHRWRMRLVKRGVIRPLSLEYERAAHRHAEVAS